MVISIPNPRRDIFIDTPYPERISKYTAEVPNEHNPMMSVGLTKGFLGFRGTPVYQVSFTFGHAGDPDKHVFSFNAPDLRELMQRMSSMCDEADKLNA